MDEECTDADTYGSQPCTPQSYNPMMPSTSRVATPVTPSRMSNRQVPVSPFRAQPQNMEPSISRVHELREGAAGKRSYTNEWMQNSYIPPTSQQQFSRAPSMIGSTISNMSNMSQLSQMTKFSALSVNTEYGQFNNWINESQPVLSKVSHSSMENQDPMQRRKRMSIPEIIQSLASTEVSVQASAIRELEPLAKKWLLEQTYGQADLKLIIRALFQVLYPREVENENVIRKTFEILHHSVMLTSRHARNTDKIFLSLNAELMNSKSSIYEIVIKRAERLDTVYESSAMVLLTHLCCKPYLMRHVFSEKVESPAHQRLHQTVMEFAVKNLNNSETKPKNKGFSVSIIKNLSRTNGRIRYMAKQMDVINIFLSIIRNEYSDEDLLWPTMQALTTFCSDSENGSRFVVLGGAQVLCGLLSHGSTRLLHELLGCMRKLADLPAIQNQDMEESIHSVIRLVGCDDVTIVERATGVLRNIGLHNKMNKAIMVQNGVTSHALAVLRTSDRFRYQQSSNVDFTRQQILSIYENCLSILNNVTLMSQNDIIESAVHACQMISENPDSAHVLLHYFNVGNRKCRKLAVTVMKRVIEAVPSFAEPFVDLLGTTNEPLAILLLQRAYESLQEWKQTIAELMRMDQDTQQRREVDEKRKDHEDIVKRSVGLLTNLCRHGNPRFFDSLRHVLANQRNTALNPFLWITKDMSDSILPEWLEFILSICCTEWSQQNCLLYWFLKQANITQDDLQTLRNTRGNERVNEKANEKIRTYIDRIIDLGCRQQQLQNQQQMLMAQQQQQQM